MKKTIIVMTAGLLLLGAGCAQSPEPVVEQPEAVDLSGVKRVSIDMSQGGVVIEEERAPLGIFVEGYGRDDCVGLEIGDNKGHNLLELLKDPEKDFLNPRSISLKIFTPKYLNTLNDRLQAEAAKSETMFYGFAVCHLGDGVDVVSGNPWPIDQSTEAMNYTSETALYVVQEDRIDVYEGEQYEQDATANQIKLVNNTATGAEVFPCTGKIENEVINWDCFMGLNIVDDEVDRSKIKRWVIPLDGGKVKIEEFIEE